MMPCRLCGRDCHTATGVHPCCERLIADGALDCPACQQSDAIEWRTPRDPQPVDDQPAQPRVPTRLDIFTPSGEYGPLAGATCICPPDCTRNSFGDGPRTCKPGCVVCRMFAGRRYDPGLFGKPPAKAER